MKIVGITGGIGSGKSTVAHILRNRGWRVDSSDDIARDIMDDPAVVEEIAKVLGPDVVEGGSLNRGRIARLIFGSEQGHAEARSRVNSIVHPLVLQKHIDLLDQYAMQDCSIAAIETALLYEIGLQGGFDYIILVTAPVEVRAARIMTRGLTREEAMNRITSQLETEETKGDADFIIENAGTLTQLNANAELTAQIIESLE